MHGLQCSTAHRRAHRAAGPGNAAKRQAVPPTVSPSMRSVGWPTPTGTLWPSLPQMPTPVSSSMSLPIIVTRVSASGPLPISVAPLTGYVDLAVLDPVRLARREHELAAGDVDLAAAEVGGVQAAS